MKYIIWIIIFSQICSVAILGCLTSSKKEGDNNNNNNKLLDDQNDDDIPIVVGNLTGFILNLDINGTYKPSEITITLTNLGNVSVTFETYQINFPRIEITDSQDKKYTIFHGNISIAPHFEIMERNDTITKQFSLHSPSGYFDENFHLIHESIFKEGENYTCQVFAYNLESNRVDFTY